jgi:hypothetical protein
MTKSDQWYTPPHIFEAIGLEFDLDPCSPGEGLCHVPAKTVFTQEGLEREWFGRVFMNPPFGGRNWHIPWLEKFINHGNGIGIIRAYTSSGWWHDHMGGVEVICFPRGKTKFLRPDGSVGGSPDHGVAIFAMGSIPARALELSELGMMWRVNP